MGLRLQGLMLLRAQGLCQVVLKIEDGWRFKAFGAKRK